MPIPVKEEIIGLNIAVNIVQVVERLYRENCLGDVKARLLRREEQGQHEGRARWTGCERQDGRGEWVSA